MDRDEVLALASKFDSRRARRPRATRTQQQQQQQQQQKGPILASKSDVEAAARLYDQRLARASAYARARRRASVKAAHQRELAHSRQLHHNTTNATFAHHAPLRQQQQIATDHVQMQHDHHHVQLQVHAHTVALAEQVPNPPQSPENAFVHHHQHSGVHAVVHAQAAHAVVHHAPSALHVEEEEEEQLVSEQAQVADADAAADTAAPEILENVVIGSTLPAEIAEGEPQEQEHVSHEEEEQEHVHAHTTAEQEQAATSELANGNVELPQKRIAEAHVDEESVPEKRARTDRDTNANEQSHV